MINFAFGMHNNLAYYRSFIAIVCFEVELIKKDSLYLSTFDNQSNLCITFSSGSY